ncbi:DUF3786 domain-containing protein [Romboutsia sp.]|uniref:DUF3786 domain-containing protein n=1 Tax=Romboutsia sp. TaxID=1965302 RepID=UPI003F2D534B
MESNYKVAYKAEWDKLKQLDPLEVSKRLEIKYCEKNKQFIVPFFEKNYILDFNTETIYMEEDGHKPVIGDAIIILNYLTYSNQYITNTNKWVSLKEIPNGGALFYPAFYNSSIVGLIEKFGENIKNFEANSLSIGGKKIKFGDKSYEFKVLPKISICVVIWEGDDEISANASILYDPAIQYLVHIETVIGVGMCVANKVMLT